MLSGYLNVDLNRKSALAYIFYASAKVEALSDIVKYPTIVILNGGPGSASMNMDFMEMGPMIVDFETLQFKKNPNSWTSSFNLLFVDQPIGTGYSYAASEEDVPKTDFEIAQQFVFAMDELLNSCPLKYYFSFGNWFFYGREYAAKYISGIVKLVI
jgi:carboxypeptidase C (cathepsin A)